MAIGSLTRKELWANAANKCSICKIKLIYRKKGKKVYNIGEECHIISQRTKGPRHKAGLANYDLYENFILLCRNHHIQIDTQIDDFTVLILTEIKTKHEAWIDQTLSSVGFTNSVAVKKLVYRVIEDYMQRKITFYKPVEGEKKVIESTLHEIISREKKQHRYILLSTAGFGKSMELKYIAGQLSHTKSDYYPFFYSLKNYQGDTIPVLLKSLLKNYEQIPANKIVLLFDGLDEIENKFTSIFTARLNEYTDANPDMTIILSCRSNFYTPEFPLFPDLEVLRLDDLEENDITNYLQNILESNYHRFLNTVNIKFSEYLFNPFYLTRLVKFFKADGKVPSTLSDFYDQIIFEKVLSDETRYDKKEAINHLQPLIQKIAFIMTLTGRSALSAREIIRLVPDKRNRDNLKYFSILVETNDPDKSLEFEHNNLREYFCAVSISALSFEDIISLISLPYNRDRINPIFSNTLLFIFEILGKQQDKFLKLLDWLLEYNPETLVQFEKEYLNDGVKFDVFSKILLKYKELGLTIRTSLNFSPQHLATFVGNTHSVMAFLIKEIYQSTSEVYVDDLLEIISSLKDPYVHKKKILDLFYQLLNDQTRSAYTHSRIIDSIRYCQFNEKVIIDSIITSGIDLSNVEVRRAILYLLNSNDCFEDYFGFTLASVEILETHAKGKTYHGYFTSIKRLLLKVESSENIIRIFEFGSNHPDSFGRRDLYDRFHFELEEIKLLLQKAEAIFPTRAEIISLVIKIFTGQDYIDPHSKWFDEFKDFFKKTFGLTETAKFFYKNFKAEQTFNYFVTIEFCLYFINEFKEGKIEEHEIRMLRNYLFWRDEKLCQEFENLSNELGIKDLEFSRSKIDYVKVNTAKKRKNKKMLLNRELFFKEAKVFLSLLKTEELSFTTLYRDSDATFERFENTLPRQAADYLVRNYDNIQITKPLFYEYFADDNNWNFFVAQKIADMAADELDGETILVGLLRQWCIEMINNTDFWAFSDSRNDHYIQTRNGYQTLGEHVEFLKRQVIRFDFPLTDSQWLKLLPSDIQSYDGIDADNNSTISALVLKNVQDRLLLNRTIINNIRSKQLMTYVTCGHFFLCESLKLDSCKGDLFDFITNNEHLHDHNKIRLTEVYISLGGDVGHFYEYITEPNGPHAHIQHSWNWFLLEQLLPAHTDELLKILLNTLKAETEISNKITASKFLIMYSKIEGLQFLTTHILNTKSFPLEDNWAQIKDGIVEIDPVKTLPLLMIILEFYYTASLNSSAWTSRILSEIVFDNILAIIYKYDGYLEKFLDALDTLISKYEQEKFVVNLKTLKNRVSDLYYKNKAELITLDNANKKFQILFPENSQ